MGRAVGDDISMHILPLSRGWSVYLLKHVGGCSQEKAPACAFQGQLISSCSSLSPLYLIHVDRQNDANNAFQFMLKHDLKALEARKLHRSPVVHRSDQDQS